MMIKGDIEMTEREELIAVINKAFDDCEAPSQQVYSADIADAILEWIKQGGLQ